VTFAPGETIQTLLLEVLADDVPEIEEVRGLASIEWHCKLCLVLVTRIDDCWCDMLERMEYKLFV
jgi:hypothetical protein